MTASAICQIKDGASVWYATTSGVTVTPGNTVTVGLVSTAGADVWTLECIAADETTGAGAITSGLTVDQPTKTATFTAPAAGKALIFRSRVQTSGDARPVEATFEIHTLAASGNRVIALGESLESDPTYGWITKLNPLLRAVAGGGAAPAGTGVVTVTGGAYNTPAPLTLAGDVTGTSSAAVVSALRGRALAATAPTDQQALVWDAGAVTWRPGTVAPTGTGFAHETAGVQDAAAALIDVSNSAHVKAVSAPPDVNFRPMYEQAYRRHTSDATKIDRLGDKSGSGLELTQATAANCPGIAVDAVNGHAALDFTGTTGQALTGLTLPNFIGTTGSDFVFWAVFRATAIVGTNADASAYNNEGIWGESAGGYLACALQNLSSTYYLVMFAWDGSAKVVKVGIALNTWYVVQGRHTGGTMYLRANSSAEISTAIGNPTSMAGAMRIGQASGSASLTGQIATLAFAAAPSVAADTAAGGRLERTRKWLGAKYGITVT